MDDLVTEYGERMGGGGYRTWDTSPELEEIYPLAKHMEHMRRNGVKMYRRRIIVVDDWAEVAEPDSRAQSVAYR